MTEMEHIKFNYNDEELRQELATWEFTFCDIDDLKILNCQDCPICEDCPLIKNHSLITLKAADPCSRLHMSHT